MISVEKDSSAMVVLIIVGLELMLGSKDTLNGLSLICCVGGSGTAISES